MDQEKTVVRERCIVGWNFGRGHACGMRLVCISAEPCRPSPLRLPVLRHVGLRARERLRIWGSGSVARGEWNATRNWGRRRCSGQPPWPRRCRPCTRRTRLLEGRGVEGKGLRLPLPGRPGSPTVRADQRSARKTDALDSSAPLRRRVTRPPACEKHNRDGREHGFCNSRRIRSRLLSIQDAVRGPPNSPCPPSACRLPGAVSQRLASGRRPRTAHRARRAERGDTPPREGVDPAPAGRNTYSTRAPTQEAWDRQQGSSPIGSRPSMRAPSSSRRAPVDHAWGLSQKVGC